MMYPTTGKSGISYHPEVCVVAQRVRKRRQFSNQFKFTVALEAVKGLKTINQIAGKFNAHPLLCRHMAQPN